MSRSASGQFVGDVEEMNKSRGSHMLRGCGILGVGDARSGGVPSSRTKCGVEANGPESGHLATPLVDQTATSPRQNQEQTFASRQSFLAGTEEVHGKARGRIFWSSSSVSQARLRPHKARGIKMVSPELDSRGKLPNPSQNCRRLGWKANA